MDNNKLKEIFIDRAEVEDAERVICDNCFEHAVFYLRDSQGREFSLGLMTVLECVVFAISQGELPKLPSDWLYDVDNVYGTDLSEREGIFYYHNRESADKNKDRNKPLPKKF